MQREERLRTELQLRKARTALASTTISTDPQMHTIMDLPSISNGESSEFASSSPPSHIGFDKRRKLWTDQSVCWLVLVSAILLTFGS